MKSIPVNYQEAYFFTLIHSHQQERKKRSCLKCNHVFESSHFAHRICAICSNSNRRVGSLGASVGIL